MRDDSGRAGEDLARLHGALAAKRVPGLRLELSGTPAVHTEGTCTRVRGGCFVIRRVSPQGRVLETASLGVGSQGAAVCLIGLMSGALTL